MTLLEQEYMHKMCSKMLLKQGNTLFRNPGMNLIEMDKHLPVVDNDGVVIEGVLSGNLRWCTEH